jgi:hypothetical protein
MENFKVWENLSTLTYRVMRGISKMVFLKVKALIIGQMGIEQKEIGAMGNYMDKQL